MLTLLHDYTSPASAVAVARAGRLVDQGLMIAFEGFEVLGVDIPLPVTVDVVAELVDLHEAAAAEAVVLRRPAVLPPTGLAHVVGDLAEETGRGATWRPACYRAFWEVQADLADADVLRTIAVRAGLDPEAVDNVLADRLRLAAVRRRCAGRRREGVGAAPMLVSQRTLVPGLVSEDDLRLLAELG